MRRTKRAMYEIRDELANRGVNIWRDAQLWSQTQNQVLSALNRGVYEHADWKRIPQYAQEYVRGFIRSFEVNFIQRQYQESGDWVRMPDGSVEWFGVRERLRNPLPDGITHRYIYENKIPERSGIYWVESGDKASARKAGEKPYFIPAIDFDPWWDKETATFDKPKEAYQTLEGGK